MAGERIVVWGSAKTLEGNGGVCANGAIVQAMSQGYAVEADGLGFPDVQFVLRANFAAAPIENGVIALCAQQLNLDGSDAADVPEPTRPGKVIGTFVVNNVTTAQLLEIVAQDVPRYAMYYLLNVNTGQSISTGWTLKAIPKTEKLAA